MAGSQTKYARPHTHTHTHTFIYVYSTHSQRILKHTHVDMSGSLYGHTHINTHAHILCIHRESYAQFVTIHICRHTHLYTCKYLYLHICLPSTNDWGCRMHWLCLRGVRHPPNECPRYDTKQSVGEALVIPELWEIRSNFSMPLFSGSLWLGVVAPDRVLSMGHIELFDI